MTKEEIISLPLEEISREESYTKAILPLMLIHSCKEASLEIRYVVLKTTSMEGPFKVRSLTKNSTSTEEARREAILQGGRRRK